LTHLKNQGQNQELVYIQHPYFNIQTLAKSSVALFTTLVSEVIV